MTPALRDAIDTWRRAIEASDADDAAAVLADEFMLTSEGGTAPQMLRSEWLKALPELETSSFEVDVHDAREFGNVAVVASRATWSARWGDRDLSGVYAMTDVFVRRDGRWLAAWRVSTRIPA